LTSKINILIAGNSYLLLAGIRSLVCGNPDFNFQGEANDLPQLAEKLMLFQSGLLIIDSNCGAFSPEDIKTILKRNSCTKVLAVSSFADALSVNRAIESGIHSLLLTDCDREEILEAIYKTAAGDKFMCGKIVALAAGEKDRVPETSCAGLNITEREIEIIKLLAEGYSNKQIADLLFLSTHTINTHRKNIMAKLGVNNAAGLVLFAVRENLISPNKYLFSSPN
jgi:DNA-binding NarL/FixJ family response regulator